MRILKWIFIVVLLVVGWLVGWSNSTIVNFQFLSWTSPDIPAYIVYLTFLALGLLLGIILGRFVRSS
ncbi:DUF1049 domain-containing protein [Reinekea marinisedimentorum]|uniref:Uncharacterized protein DUF1049 n=1 Tax=Reinekea marinisedimentorum TaxID=230495 RepID=A0A4R3I7A0_9GAMM|nr:DUF1049 domain-containing protein [Reinekea marinisedimentorum]TCS39979.1 uncharacterized protein DUF1049 [Reinekea marinisedimentorum]